MKVMIDTLIKLKMNKTKTPRKADNSGLTKLVTLADFEKDLSSENHFMPKTADIGVAATSKDIDSTFKGMVKFSSGDQWTKQNQKINPDVKSKQRKVMPRELQKEKYPKPVSKYDDHLHIKNRILRGQIDPKIIPKQVTLSNQLKAPKRQMNFDNELIPTTNSTRQRIINNKHLNIDRAESQKVINKKNLFISNRS